MGFLAVSRRTVDCSALAFLMKPKQKGLGLQRLSILKQVISKGGIIALPAKMFLKDKEKGTLCIIEYFEQCHNQMALEHWGNSLVSEIIHYRCEILRREFRKVNRELNELRIGFILLPT